MFVHFCVRKGNDYRSHDAVCGNGEVEDSRRNGDSIPVVSERVTRRISKVFMNLPRHKVPSDQSIAREYYRIP